MATVRDILLQLHQQYGELTPEVVRDAARPEDSPIHTFVFDKEVGDAAEAYYLDRAHRLIQVARVTMKQVVNEPPRRVRAFYAVPSEGRPYVYEPVETILASPSKCDAVRREALRRLHDAERAVEDLDSLLTDTVQAAKTRKAVRTVRKAREDLATIVT